MTFAQLCEKLVFCLICSREQMELQELLDHQEFKGHR